MRHEAPQFPLPISPSAEDARAPLVLRVESTQDGARVIRDRGSQPELIECPAQPPASTPEEWLRRLPPTARRRVQRNRKGPVGFREIDPATGLPFA